MTKKKITILKLGGSLLTDKSTPYKLREGILDSIASELLECIKLGLIESLIVIHGVGSFGHPPVIEFKLYTGFRNANQLVNLSKTQNIVNKFRLMIVDSFIKAGIPVNLMHTSSMVVRKKGNISHFALDALKGYLSIGMVPLIGGDMIYDREIGFSICSGDLLAVHIARELGANQLIFASDVEGVYDKDPKVHSNAVMIKEININEIEIMVSGMEDTNRKDITGRMKGKLLSIIPMRDLIEKGLKVSILSMRTPNTLKKFLEGDENLATRIKI
jgi:isopentenyl phosphate kinase